jgi:hypothetical protein
MPDREIDAELGGTTTPNSLGALSRVDVSTVLLFFESRDTKLPAAISLEAEYPWERLARAGATNSSDSTIPAIRLMQFDRFMPSNGGRAHLFNAYDYIYYRAAKQSKRWTLRPAFSTITSMQSLGGV